MARGVKKAKAASLTPEEKLAQALVPVEEQPYPVPGNWCWVYLPSLCEYMRAGGDKPQNMSNVKTEEYQIPVVANGLQEDGIIGYTNIENEKAGTVTVSGRGTIGHSVLRDYSYYPVIRLIVLSPNKAILSAYLKYVFDHFEVEGTGTSIPQLTVPSLRNKTIPLPPLTEQQRIVDRIESLFAKLDEAKEKAQAVVDGFEDRKAAILHKAFRGALSREWADSHGISSTSWKMVRFDEIAVVKSNLVNPNDYMDYPHIAPDNIEKKTGRLLEYRTIAEDGVTSGKHRFYAGQILYSKIRPYLSKVVVVDFDGLCSADMYPIEPKKGVKTRFLWYYMLSDDFLTQASTAGSRTVLPKINQKELSKILVRITNYNEQEQIVMILDKLLEKEQQAKEAAEQTLTQIDTMKKAILARAFRGELGTNDPTEEPATKLLKEIFQQNETRC